MNEEKLKVGDVVVLNSGGPLMTVTSAVEPIFSTEPDRPVKVNCAWANESGKIERASFPVECLRLRKEPKIVVQAPESDPDRLVCQSLWHNEAHSEHSTCPDCGHSWWEVPE